jgi:hypothetical protein
MSFKYLEPTIAALQTTYPTDPTLDAGFEGQVSVSLMSLVAGSEVFISTDGTNDQAHLKAGTPAVTWSSSNNSYTKVWARSAGVATPIQIQVETFDY